MFKSPAGANSHFWYKHHKDEDFSMPLFWLLGYPGKWEEQASDQAPKLQAVWHWQTIVLLWLICNVPLFLLVLIILSNAWVLFLGGAFCFMGFLFCFGFFFDCYWTNTFTKLLTLLFQSWVALSVPYFIIFYMK